MKRLIITAVVGAALVAGCASAPPVPSETPTVQAGAALLEPQAQRIVDDTFATLAAADAKRDPALLSPRIGADAASVRAAEYAIQNATGAAPATLPSTMQRVYVSQEQAWPRIMAAVSQAPDQSLTPVVYLWVQDSVDSPYQLRAWAHMIPGASLPAMPGAVDGAVQLPVGETGQAPEPRATLESYLEYLRQGAGSALAASFAPDTYASQLFAARDTLSQAASQAAGGYVDTVQPQLDGTYVLSAADGGSLIFAPVQISSSFSVSGATLKVSDHDAPLLTGPASTKVTYQYDDLVIIYVPPAGSTDLPAVVAAEHHLVQVRPE